MEQHGVVYCLTDGKNSYIGSTFNLVKRKYTHKSCNYLQKILNNKNHRYDIMKEGEYTKRELLDAEKECIENNDCINKRKPLTMFKNKHHKYMLKWGKEHVRCEACNCDITRWNWCKHTSTLKHKANAGDENDLFLGGKMTYMRAVAIYNKQKKAIDDTHIHIIPKKGTVEQAEVLEILSEHILNE